MGALLLPSASSLPTTVRSLQASLRSSWLPGSSLRSLMLLPSTVEDLGRVGELSSLNLAQVLYLLQGPGHPSLHRLDPAT